MTSHLTIRTPDGSFSAYVARPIVARAPAIVVLQEIFGVNADLRETCDELAQMGYLALSPDLFWRQEPGVDMSDRTEAEWKKGLELYSAFDYEAAVADIVTTLRIARTMEGGDGKVGLLGFCLGGLLTFLVTARAGADASVVYYGGRTDEYLDEASQVETPLLMHLGEQDEYIPQAAREAIVEALRGNPFAQVYTYPGCRHAFARHGGAHYDAAAATLANCRTGAFFDVNLRPSAGSHPTMA